MSKRFESISDFLVTDEEFDQMPFFYGSKQRGLAA